MTDIHKVNSPEEIRLTLCKRKVQKTSTWKGINRGSDKRGCINGIQKNEA